jgi:hypothetical protein
VADVLDGDLHHARNVLGLDAVRGQRAGDADAGLERLEPGHEGRTAASHLADVGEFIELRRHGLVVPGHHRVDHQRVGQAVVQVAHRTQRMRGRMHRAEVLLEGDRTHHRRHHHVAARLQVAGLRDRGVQGGCSDACPLQRNAIAQRVVGRREIALDVVCERIHSGGGRHCRRQAQREFGIGKHHPGKNLRAEDNTLEMRVVLAHH